MTERKKVCKFVPGQFLPKNLSNKIRTKISFRWCGFSECGSSDQSGW